MAAVSARHRLYAKLTELEEAARHRRQELGLPYSRREVEREAREKPSKARLDARRISSWVPEDAASAQVPYDPEPADFLMLVKIWSAWAERPYRKHDWIGYLASARRERAAALPPATALRITMPAVPAGFCGREGDLQVVLDALAPASGAHAGVCIAGLAGVGKTALALAAAEQAQQAGLFAIVLFADLLGYHETPASPADILAVLLRGLDADVAAAGPDTAGRAAAYRSRLAELAREGRPVLIIADNAADAAVVRSLVPPGGPHRLLVTSRHTLHTLDARLIDLRVLPDDESAELVANALRTASPADPRARPEELTGLARLCGGLPLALRIAAALLIREPHLSAAELARDLAAIGPLEILDDGEYAVRSALELSYRRLPADLAELFCLLALNPGPDLSTGAAKALTGLSRHVLRRRLAELGRAHLVDGNRTAGRWHMHDLVRAFAAQCLEDLRQSAPDDSCGQAGQRRLFRYYLTRLDAADSWIRGFEPRKISDGFQSRDQALQWLDTEHVNLLGAVETAALTGNGEEAARLALALTDYLAFRLLREEAAWMLGIAEQVAPAPFQRAQLLDNLGNVLCSYPGRKSEAIPLHEQARKLFHEMGCGREEGLALNHLGIAHRRAGHPADAIASYERALAILEQTGPAWWLAAVLNNLAAARSDQGNFPQALRAAGEAVWMSRVAENKKVEVTAQFNRYTALFGMRNYPQALEAIRSAIACSADEAVPPHERGQLLAALANALRAAGHPEQERRAVLQAAADAFDEAGLPALSQMFRDPQATPPTPKGNTFSSQDQVQQRPGDEQAKG